MEKRVFNQDKTQELTDYDLFIGRLEEDKLVLAHHDAVEGKTVEENVAAAQADGKTVKQIDGVWYIVTAAYENGGEDISKVLPTEHKDAWDETEDIYVYIPYTENELAVIAANQKISEAKAYLRETDYIVLKIAEATAEGDAAGVAALQEEYAVQLAARKQARAAVNANEESIIALQKDI